MLQSQLVEVVLDLGRPVLARYSHGDEVLSSVPLSRDELQEVVAKVTVTYLITILSKQTQTTRGHPMAHLPKQQMHDETRTCSLSPGWRIWRRQPCWH